MYAPAGPRPSGLQLGGQREERALARGPADELDVPLLGKIPLQEELRVSADEGRPLVLDDPDAPAAQALYHAASGIIAATPQELGVLQEPSGPPLPEITGTALPMA